MTSRRVQVRKGSDIGAAISALRNARSISQSELAAMAGIGTSYLSKIETGRTSSILEHELRILRRLGATITIELP